MRRIEIYESNQSCCGPSASASLVSFLQRKFQGEVDVQVVDLAAAKEESLNLPGPLLDLIATKGRGCLPAMLLDGAVVSSGALPNFLDVVALVRGSRGEAASPRGAA